MFLIELTYKAPLTDIDATMRAHVKFLNKYYRQFSRVRPQDSSRWWNHPGGR